jgi:hypothetical protein
MNRPTSLVGLASYMVEPNRRVVATVSKASETTAMRILAASGPP